MGLQDPDPSINKHKIKKNLDYNCVLKKLNANFEPRKKIFFVCILKTTAEKSRIRKILGFQDPDPSINKQKISKTLILTVL